MVQTAVRFALDKS